MVINLDLARIGVTDGVQKITATGVPGPSASGPDDEIVHLIIDCVYSEALADLGAARLLACARADTVAILRFSIVQPWFSRFRAVSIRFLFIKLLKLPHPPDWLHRGVRKVYVYYVETEGLPTDPQAIEARRLPEYPHAGEHSESEVICRLLSTHR